MSTYDFQPTSTQNFQFQPTLDGNVYSVIVNWNAFGQRYYINLYDLSGVLVVSRPLVGSPNDYPIDLVGGYFTSSKMVFYQASQQFVVTP